MKRFFINHALTFAIIGLFYPLRLLALMIGNKIDLGQEIDLLMYGFAGSILGMIFGIWNEFNSLRNASDLGLGLLFFVQLFIALLYSSIAGDELDGNALAQTWFMAICFAVSLKWSPEYHAFSAYLKRIIISKIMHGGTQGRSS